jgi:hypothetical protein
VWPHLKELVLDRCSFTEPALHDLKKILEAAPDLEIFSARDSQAARSYTLGGLNFGSKKLKKINLGNSGKYKRSLWEEDWM